MALTESSSFSGGDRPLRSTQLPSEAYVLALAALPDTYAAAASAPSSQIHIVDKASLRDVLALGGHDGGITHLRAVDAVAGTNRRVLVSSGRDASVSVWDDRTRSAALQMRPAGRPSALLSCDVSQDGMLVAAGTVLQNDDALIHYWDPRNPAAPLRSHSSTHSDDITAVHFLRPSLQSPPLDHRVILSCSSDGLVSTSNADEDDEDEAVLHVGNWGCSISQAGWITQNSSPPRVWAGSDMETFSTWSDELQIAHDLDIRVPSVHSQQRTWVTDYLIGCHMSSESGLGVFVGSNEGDIALLRNADYADGAAPWSLERIWANGHTGVVRSMLWDEQHNILVTGGEDSRIRTWSCPPLPREHDGTMDAESTSTSSRKRDFDGDIEMGSPTNAFKKARRQPH